MTRQFVAQPPFIGSKLASKTTPAWQKSPAKSQLLMAAGVFGFTAVLIALWLVMQALTDSSAEWVQATAGHAFRIGGVLLLLGGGVGWYWWSRRRKIVICATRDGLTVSTRPGEVYSFKDAKLGTWGITGGMTMGTALHLHSGPDRFILAGRDHRLARGTRLDAPDVGYGLPIDIDASVSGFDFDEILGMVGGCGGVQVQAPASGEPTRCVLFTNPLLVHQMNPFASRRRQEFMASLGEPRLAIDFGAEAIRVVDPNTNVVIAAASPVQVTAEPVTYRPSTWHMSATGSHFMADILTNYLNKMPCVVVSVPGMPPLTIGTRDSCSGLDFRFSWPDHVATRHDRAEYVVSGADWLTLVEAFGLPYLEKRGKSGMRPAERSS